MRMLTRIGLLLLLSAGLASSASADLELNVEQVAGPLNTIPSGRLLCGATNALPGYGEQDIVLTIHDSNGAPVKTQDFHDVPMFNVVEIEHGPGKTGSHLCLAESTNGVSLSLTYKNSLQQAQASVGGASEPITDFSVAGPLEPGNSGKIVCKAATGQTQEVELSIIDDNGVIVAGPTTLSLNGAGSGEISTNSFYGRQYTCVGIGQQEGSVQATIESQGSLGDPKAASSGTAGPSEERCDDECCPGDTSPECGD